MKILVVGSGGREHAICWRLSQYRNHTLFVAPGNPGIWEIANRVNVNVTELDKLVSFAVTEQIDLVIIGPELPLTLGLADALKAKGVRVFGPSKEAATIEASKQFSKDLMIAAGVSTARYETVGSRKEAEVLLSNWPAPVVLKADGLAAGKGVFVCMSNSEIPAALDGLFSDLKADKIIIEEFLIGKEASFIVATDGDTAFPLAACHDYKRLLDGHKGPNTGGMGTVSPTPHLSTEQEEVALQTVVYPVLREMKKRGTPFVGFLYPGLMIEPSGAIKVLEFNCRLGDPETQSIMRRLNSDLGTFLVNLLDKKDTALTWSQDSVVTLVLAADGYPENPVKGDEIFGIEQAQMISGVVVFHAGTAQDSNGRLVTAGGRVLNVTATGKTIEEARSLAYKAADLIQFRGLKIRRDIGIN